MQGVNAMSLEKNIATGAESDPETKSDEIFDQAYLINKLNFINFIDGLIDAVYFDPRRNVTTALSVLPLPCGGPELACRWASSRGDRDNPAALHFRYLLVPDRDRFLVVKPEVHEITSTGLRFRLPETCRPLANADTVRRINPHLTVRMYQKGVEFHGRLLHFSNGSYEIAVDFKKPQSRHWIDPLDVLYLVLAMGEQTCYSGTCRVQDDECDRSTDILKIRAVEGNHRRYPPKKYRSKRIRLSSPPDAVLTHPLSLRRMVLKVDDMSTLGFSVIADPDEDELFCGLILRDIRLETGGQILAVPTVQVVHRSLHKCATENPEVRYGLAILNMTPSDHLRLQRMLQKEEDPDTYINRPVAQHALWEFFFETGFIYPEKYSALKERKIDIKQTIKKFYVEQPAFARHFIYQKNGVILGHMAILRFYSRAWLIHHHAAQKSGSSRAGLRVLEQVVRFINEAYTLEDLQMDYIFFFYRPENKFADLLFGKFAQYAGDPKKCSLDRFAYGHFPLDDAGKEELPVGWTLTRARDEDLHLLKIFYEKQSGGLMAAAFDMADPARGIEEIKGEYEQFGFKREQHLFALKKDGAQKAVIEASLSEKGLNMSDLTNCIRLFLVDTEAVTERILSAALMQLAEFFEGADVPVLLYPAEAAVVAPFPVKRHYMLWVASLQGSTEWYYAFFNRIFRFSRSKR
jgi:hypothetical protein